MIPRLAAAAAAAATRSAAAAALPPAWDRLQVARNHPPERATMGIGGVQLAIPPFYDLAVQGRAPMLLDAAINSGILKVC